MKSVLPSSFPSPLAARPAAVVLFFFTVAVLLLSAMDRYHIVSQFKQRERVVIIDPAGICYYHFQLRQ